jgi:hypothetical protein
MRRWFWNILVAFDQLLNAATGGEPDETVSSRVGREREKSRIARMVAGVLDWIDTDHTFDSVEYEPGTDRLEPHHFGEYDERRRMEEDALREALASPNLDDLDIVVLQLAEAAARRQRLREEARDRF